MNNLYFLSQFLCHKLHDILDVLLNKLSLPLYLYDFDEKTSDSVLIEIPKTQANRILLESRSGKNTFLLEIRHSPSIKKENDHNIYMSKEEHLAQVRLQRNTVILSKDKEFIDEITFKETSNLKKGYFTVEDFVVISDEDLIAYFRNKNLSESIDPAKLNKLLKNLLSYERDIDELIKLMEVFNPNHSKRSRPLVCAIESWAAMQIDGEESSGKHSYLTRSKKVIENRLKDKGYSFSSNLVEQISFVSNADEDRDKGSIKYITKKEVDTSQA